MNKNVYVALEHRFYEFEGELYTKLSFSYNYWKDYLSFFDKVVVVARVKKINYIDGCYSKVSGPRVSFVGIPYYVGIKEFVFKFPRLFVKSKNIVKAGDYFILRSGNVCNLLWVWIVINRKRYLREYPGNIYEGVVGFSGGSFTSRILGRVLDRFAKLQAKRSCANSFVSQYCNDIYSSNKPSYIFSSFNSDEIKVSKNGINKDNKKNVISIGRLEGEKGHEDLINAFSLITNNATLHIVGEGTHFNALKSLATKKNIDIKFYGAITNRDELFRLLSSMDLFVIPSHTEGMPRSLLEAMAVGLPCVGSCVGGIPEVLEEEYTFEPKKIEQCAKLLDNVLSSDSLMKEMSDRNKGYIESNFSNESLQHKRIAFWSELYK